VLIRLGDHAAASAMAETLVQAARTSGDHLYVAACYLARCVPLAGKDTKLPDAKRRERARRYGDRAVELLREAVAKGYTDVKTTREDKDLDALRQRDDFQKLLAEMAKAKPAQK
jgi:hypothetical protein